MKIETDDPRLTAYAIGELDPGEAAEVEAALADSPSAMEEVAAIRETAALLEEEFGATPPLALSEQQRSEVIAGGAPGAKVVEPGPDAFSRVSRWLGISAAAACVVGASAIGVKEFLLREEKAAGESTPPPAVVEGETERDEVVAPTEAGREGGAGGRAAQHFGAGGGDDDAFAAAGEVELDATESRGENFRLKSAAKAKAKTEMAERTLPQLQRRELGRARQEPSQDAVRALEMVEEKAFAEQASPGRDVARRNSLRSGLASADGFDESDDIRLRAPAPMPKASVTPPSTSAPPAPEAAAFDGLVPDAEVAAAESLAGARSPGAGGIGDLLEEEALGGKRRYRQGGESYGRLYDTPFLDPFTSPKSTFAIDVDTGSYSNMRRFVARRGMLPPKDAVRVEEMINYFDYDYPAPSGEHPLAVDLEVAACPWERGHRLVRIGLKAKGLGGDGRPPSNLVFLIDSSGSMRDAAKLPLLKTSLAALARHLTEDDRIGIVTYAGSASVALDPVHGDQREKVIDAIDALRAGGSTNGAGGIELAYKLAAENYVEGGTNRVILATDGDFNVGVTDDEALVEMVKARAERDKVFLTVLGFGEGNLHERRMEQIANRGDGSYHYIDGEEEGRRVLVDKLGSTLVAVAKDVKVQVDFNPAKVGGYRLIGYANRRLAAKDFRDDKKDAGEIGAGHTVTAFYQVAPAAGDGLVAAAAAGSKYRKVADAEVKEATLVESDELLNVSLRYKEPEGEVATEFEVPLTDPGGGWEDASDDFRFGAAVAGFGMLLRESEFGGMLNYDLVLELASEGKGDDEHGLRGEFVELVEKAKRIAGR